MDEKKFAEVKEFMRAHKDFADMDDEILDNYIKHLVESDDITYVMDWMENNNAPEDMGLVLWELGNTK